MAVSKQVSLLVLVASIMLVLTTFDGIKAQEAQKIELTAEILPYNPDDFNWDMRAAGAFCASSDADKPLEWRQRYGWAATCGITPPCGICVQVTNVFTGVSAVARMVDVCNSKDAALQLDLSVLWAIDKDGHGSVQNVHYTLDVEFSLVDCQD